MLLLMLGLALATMPKPVGKAVERDLSSLAAMLSETRAAATRVELTVDTSGLPVHCDVTLSEGNRTLDRTACDYLMRRARFSPARDPAGAPIAAVLRLDLAVNHGSSGRLGSSEPPGARKVDFAVQVDRLPRASVMVADVVLMVDAAGNVSTCDITNSTGVAGLDRLACRQMTTAAFAPARGHDGRPVVALREIAIGFSADPVPR